MSRRTFILLLVLAVAILGVALWFKQTMEPAQPQPAPAPEASGPTAGGGEQGMPPQGMPPRGMPPQGMQGPGGEAADLGIDWRVPAGWTAQGERPMRVATYAVPRAAGDPEDGECAVFYFGPGQGGSVEDNIARWVGQFEKPGKPARTESTVDGLSVTRVAVGGTYLAPAGMNMAPTAQKKDYRLLGGIVAGPNGNVFYKLTGPRRTIEHATGAFDGMLASVKKK